MNKIRISCYEHDIERANETIALQADLLLEECKKVDDYRKELGEVENKKKEIKEELRKLKDMISGEKHYRIKQVLKKIDIIIEKCSK